MSNTYTVFYNPNFVAKLPTGSFATKTVTADQMEVNVDGSVVFQINGGQALGWYTSDIVANGAYVEVSQN